ncbi:uncharacterized protein LOC143282459 [Babylonia areolata]|uniref:uncharacterized protein LOC143282459 n=1 Tax=Babylonia areolata TaxID=304850 RepID=UPI003FD37457
MQMADNVSTVDLGEGEVEDADVNDALEVRARQNVVLCLLGIIFNSTILAVVAFSLRLRKSAKYQLIVSLSFADVFLGLIYLPLDTLMAFHGGVWHYGCSLLFLTYGFQEFVMPTIAALTLSVLCIEYALTMMCDDASAGRRRRRTVLLGVLLPWGVGLTALVPVFLLRFVTSSGAFSPPCVEEPWHVSTLVLLVGVYGYLPLAVLAGSLLLMLAAYCCRPPDDRVAVRTILARSRGVFLTHEFADTFFAGLISLGFNLPFLVELSLSVQCQGDGAWCRRERPVRHVLEVLRTVESVFFPAVWMLGMEFRHGLFTSCNCCYKYCDMEVEHALT